MYETDLYKCRAKTLNEGHNTKLERENVEIMWIDFEMYYFFYNLHFNSHKLQK